MKRAVALIAVVCVLGAGVAWARRVPKDCTLKGKQLFGKVRIVDKYPDFRVRIVSSSPDLRVQQVSAPPKRCGQWRFVDSFADFTVQFVDKLADFSIQYVDSSPGVP